MTSGYAARNSLASRLDAPSAAAINSLLTKFEKSPRTFLNAPPPFVDGQPPGRPRFSRRAIESGDALLEKDHARSHLCMNWDGKRRCLGRKLGILSEIQGSDRPEALADNGSRGFVRTLQELEEKGLMQATLPKQPWSDDYWGYYKGTLGARYADPAFPASQPNYAPGFDWKSNHQYVQAHPASLIAREGSDAELDRLSPAEKYELLIGASSFPLTKKMWKWGERYYDENGSVETWMGICQGWASAAMMLPRPRKVISLATADGKRELRFYPSDLKALADLLWADGDFNSRYIGGRCHDVHPRTDANGRILRQDCFDTNPGTWHLAVTNQIGISHRALIMDAAYDYRIWNQPVVSYVYRYFNPQVMRYVGSLEEARVSMNEFTTDRFRSYRSSRTSSVVGIVMDVTYVASTQPSHAKSDSRERDRLRKVRYVYDLELDASDKIIGGEWYMNQHPDFLWVPEAGSHAVSDFEGEAKGSWNGKGAIPASWQSAARDAAEEGEPLGKIVEALISQAKNDK